MDLRDTIMGIRQQFKLRDTLKISVQNTKSNRKRTLVRDKQDTSSRLWNTIRKRRNLEI